MNRTDCNREPDYSAMLACSAFQAFGAQTGPMHPLQDRRIRFSDEPNRSLPKGKPVKVPHLAAEEELPGRRMTKREWPGVQRWRKRAKEQQMAWLLYMEDERPRRMNVRGYRTR